MDFDLCYEQCSHCAQELRAAHRESHENKLFKLHISKAKRHLARAHTALGVDKPSHQRRIRHAQQALSELAQAILTFETEADVEDAELALRKAERRVRRIQIETVGEHGRH